MTDRELLQLILKNQEEMRSEFKSEIRGVESKIDAIAADLGEIKKDVSLLLEHDDIDTFNINGAYKEIKEVNSKLDKLSTEFSYQRRFNQKAIGDLNNDISGLDERVGQLEQEKKAS